MKDKPVIVIGNGGHARVLVETLLNAKRKILGFTAPAKEHNLYSLDYIGQDHTILKFDSKVIELVNGIGSVSNTSLREKLFNKFKSQGYFFSSVIHPSAILSPSAALGEGVQILAGSVIQPFAKIDDNTIINTSSIIDHDCHIGKHCHISPSSTLSGGIHVGEGTHIGTATTIIQNIKVGRNVLIGAGSLVIRDIKDNKVAYGTPAKEVIK